MNKVAVYCDQNFLSNQKLCLKSVSEAKMCALFLSYNCSSQKPIFYFALLTSMFAGYRSSFSPLLVHCYLLAHRCPQLFSSGAV